MPHLEDVSVRAERGVGGGYRGAAGGGYKGEEISMISSHRRSTFALYIFNIYTICEFQMRLG
jgi:hypothetical protein